MIEVVKPTVSPHGRRTNASFRSKLVDEIEAMEVNSQEDEDRMIRLFEELDDLAHSGITDDRKVDLSILLAHDGIEFEGDGMYARQFAKTAANHFVRPMWLRFCGGGRWELTFYDG